MRFAVPQFIDVEDKIFGPLTFKQFVYVTGGGGLAFIVFKLIPSSILGFLAAAPFAAFGIALAFIKVNDKPLINMIEAAFNYGVRDKLYVWKHEKAAKKAEETKNTQIEASRHYLPKISQSKLHDIAWGLDVLDKQRQ